MNKTDFERLVQRGLETRKLPKHILAINDAAETPAGMWECTVLWNEKALNIKVATAFRDSDAILADIESQLPEPNTSEF